MVIKPVVLIVEDNQSISNLIINGLGDEFIILVARGFNEAINLLRKHTVDLACLDIMLPDGNGLEICRIIRKEYPDVKIIVLSKKSKIEDRLSVFNIGADDYLPKPFFVQELSARINRLVKKKENQYIISKESLKLDTDSSTISLSNNLSKVTKGQVVILKTILTCSTKYTSLETIQKAFLTYSIKAPSKESLKVSISRLNKKVKREWGMDILRSRYGFGYYLTNYQRVNKV